MKILMVSMNSIHFRRWSEQLRNSGHEVFWFDVLDQGYAPSMSWMTQITDWKKGFLKSRGRTLFKKKLPTLFNFLSNRFDHRVDTVFEKTLKVVQPDVVHSFALYVSCTPIYNVMAKFQQIKWIYSSWGSDLYYYKNETSYLEDIKRILPRIDFLFTDCHRDHQTAVNLGFSGKFLGVFPGGGGFDLEFIESQTIPYTMRDVILVKGYENRSGRSVKVLLALEQIADSLSNFKVVVFGAEDPAVLRFRESDIPNIQIHHLLPHKKILKLMGSAMIYIGNSNSDGMPNTMLEAMCAGAYVIQSNPGGSTEEIIENGTNGSLINDCEDVEQIKSVINKALLSVEHRSKAVSFNNNELAPKLDRDLVISQVIDAYHQVAEG
ncbi:Glycosyltransferase involved in cell wall bisynthesis [Nonlabens sp. Hel1_33_55]|uniref:glycosyltransferase family 4 protein n=1 Tax=Nonlabens sp. Hel1_33_55 TaxID=1336802 RepID=UPI000875B759|nr:glycosyltransferase family 4 protein [Nonlabens sp. Hel1_33_55]SCX92459.1 Glycosyltransferase involved in cell wall bisynthesis [Nonlabens sp. Hel1_33_55]